MKKFKDLTKEEREEIIVYALKHGFTVAQGKYGIWADTIKYHADKKYREETKLKMKNKHEKLKDDSDYIEMRKRAYQNRQISGKGYKQWREWYDSNKERSSENSKRHRLENLEKYKERYRIKYLTKDKQLNRERYKNDFIYKLKANIREALRRALKYSGAAKDSPSIKYLGCSIEDFKKYIQNKFKPGMTWENHGRGEGCWHLDHIMPLNLLKEGTATLEQLCHFSNYQPLWEKENLSKNSKYE